MLRIAQPKLAGGSQGWTKAGAKNLMQDPTLAMPDGAWARGSLVRRAWHRWIQPLACIWTQKFTYSLKQSLIFHDASVRVRGWLRATRWILSSASTPHPHKRSAGPCRFRSFRWERPGLGCASTAPDHKYPPITNNKSDGKLPNAAGEPHRASQSSPVQHPVIPMTITEIFRSKRQAKDEWRQRPCRPAQKVASAARGSTKSKGLKG